MKKNKPKVLLLSLMTTSVWSHIPPYLNISTTKQDTEYNEAFGIFKEQHQKYPMYRNIINKNIHFFGYPNGTFYVYNEKKSYKFLKLEGLAGSKLKKWFIKKNSSWIEESSIREGSISFYTVT